MKTTVTGRLLAFVLVFFVPEDFRAVIHYLKENDFPYSEFISDIAVPEQAQEAMEKWASAPGKVFRILVDFQ